LILASIVSLAVTSCETTIDPTLEKADPVLVVDAWLNNKPGAQTIIISQTQPYFDNGNPTGLAGAVVQVTNLADGRVLNFTPVAGKAGTYAWQPGANEVVGQPGDVFELLVRMGSDEYTSVTYMGRVPQIDSIAFTFEPANAFFPDSYVGEFWATDPPGPGDTYWIKTFKNDTLLLRPSEINIAFDAGFSAGGNFDGVPFITPIRRGINPFNTDANNMVLSPYQPGDSVYVEINSISIPAFDFLTQVTIQTDRPGGFSELFAAPIANVSSNITHRTDRSKKVVGFFNVASVAGNGARVKAR